ncbi:PHP domain-containing protein [Haladaptatus sp. DYSN1]|uniref:PHP domain-containing protein n=1 Tax=unclassified Haladaptatus TaxID=2622732 RepID=UPI002406C62D|nr:PHP domain-containing protein [Haladaptatus sp. DYSN1]
MSVADLHAHTTASDGTMTLADVPQVAARADLDAVAITDHDTIHPGLPAPVTTHDGLTLIRGIELRVDTGGFDIDLLGYGVRETDALATTLDRIQQNRLERAREMVAAVESTLSVSLDIEYKPGIGRPHIARAIEASDAPYAYQDAFDELIGDDGPCFVRRAAIPSFEEGARLLSEACPVVSLAHPYRYPHPEKAIELAAELDAIEAYYPYARPVDDASLWEAVSAYDLLVTGGSDAHIDVLGEVTLSGAEYERFSQRLTASEA